MAEILNKELSKSRVCQDWFPNKEKPNKAGFYMDPLLRANLDALLKNASAKDDWDFLILVTAGGMVRQGKSVLALQIACYWCHELERTYGMNVPFSIKENIIFHGAKLIKQGNKIGTTHPHSVLIFDEAGADLEGVKAMKRSTQAVKDYLRECGQYNFLTILVLPEFFDLPKGIALSRSDFLIDCYALPDSTGRFRRGYFNFYSKPNKKHLYLKGKKELNYKAYRYDFHGRWLNFYPIDEEEYRAAKIRALKTREVISDREGRLREYLRGAFKYLVESGLSYREIARIIKERVPISTSHQYIGRVLGREEEETDD